jgi:uncharacterized membrane protein
MNINLKILNYLIIIHLILLIVLEKLNLNEDLLSNKEHDLSKLIAWDQSFTIFELYYIYYNYTLFY